MNELLIYRIALGVAGICFAAFAVWTFRLSPANISRFSPGPRAKLPGMGIGGLSRGRGVRRVGKDLCGAGARAKIARGGKMSLLARCR